MKLKRIFLLLTMVISFSLSAMGCGNKEEVNEEITENEVIEEVTPEEVENYITISDWKEVDGGFYTLKNYCRTITDTDKSNSIIIYQYGENDYDMTALEKGNGAIYQVGKYPKDLKGGTGAFTAVAKYTLEDNLDVVLTPEITVTSNEYDTLNQISYTINGKITADKPDKKLLIAYKVYSKTSDFCVYKVGYSLNEGINIYETIDRSLDAPKEDVAVEILGYVEVKPFENMEITYADTYFSVDYRVEETLENPHISYRQYSGTTPFVLSDNTFTGFITFHAISNSELGIVESDKANTCVYNGNGKIGTFLEIQGEQSEDPTYQFEVTGMIPFEKL